MTGPFTEESDIPPEKKKNGPTLGLKGKIEARAKEKVFRCEADLSTAIIEQFNRLKHVKCQKIKGTAYGKPTLDIMGSRHGRLFWLEVKQPGKAPTMRQYNTMKEGIDVGAIATWTTSVKGAMEFLLADWRDITQLKMLEGFHVNRD